MENRYDCRNQDRSNVESNSTINYALTAKYEVDVSMREKKEKKVREGNRTDKEGQKRNKTRAKRQKLKKKIKINGR